MPNTVALTPSSTSITTSRTASGYHGEQQPAHRQRGEAEQQDRPAADRCARRPTQGEHAATTICGTMIAAETTNPVSSVAWPAIERQRQHRGVGELEQQ